MSRPSRHGPEGAATPHEQVQELEASVQARIAAAERADLEVVQARAQAADLVAAAAEQARYDAQQLSETIIAAARSEAALLGETGVRRAAELTAIADRRLDEDVTAVVAEVLPVDPQPDRTASRP